MRAVAIAGLLLAAALLLGWSLLFGGGAPAPPPHGIAGRTAANATAAEAAAAAGSAGAAPAAGDADHRALTDAERSAAQTGPAPPAFEVRVVSPDQQPVADAELRWLDNPALVVHTDADGRGKLPVTAGHEPYLLRIAAGARHVQQRYGKPSALTVTLPWFGPLRGRVVDADSGAPIAGVRVEREHGGCRDCPKDVADSDADGAFTLPDVPRGQDAAFWFTADGYAKQFDARRLPGDGEPVDCTFRLRAGAVIAGRFVDAETRAPVADAAIVAQGKELCRSAADGAFAVRLLPDTEGMGHAEVTCDGYCRHSWMFPVTGGPTEHALQRAAKLTGSVRSTTGAALAGASVRPAQTGAGPLADQPFVRIQDAGWNLRATTDAEGRFELDGLVPGATYLLRASHADCEPLRDPPRVVVARDAAPVVVVLQAKPAVHGAGMIVGTFRLNGQPADGRLHWRAGARQDTARIDREGAFRLQGVPAGPVELTAIADRFQGAEGALADALHARRTVQLAADEELQVDLEQTVDEAPITGRVVRANGEPVAQHWLWARHQQAMWLRAMTDHDGNYALPVPRLCDAVTVGAGEDGEPRNRDVAPGASGVDFVLPMTGELRYRVTSDTGLVRFLMLILVRDGKKDARPNWTMDAPDPDGFRTLTAPRGDYTVVLSARGYAPVAHRVALGERATLDVALPPGVTVTLRLASDAAAPAAPLLVELRDEGVGEHAPGLMQMSGLDRRCELSHAGADVRHVGPGRHRLHVVGGDGVEVLPATLEVATTDATFELRWRRAAK